MAVREACLEFAVGAKYIWADRPDRQTVLSRCLPGGRPPEPEQPSAGPSPRAERQTVGGTPTKKFDADEVCAHNIWVRAHVRA